MSVIDWIVVTSAKQCQVEIDNIRENAKRVTHDYVIGNQVYVEITGIYRKLDYSKQGSYIITEVFTNGIFRVQRGQVNERINIRQINPHFDEHDLQPMSLGPRSDRFGEAMPGVSY